MGNFGKAPDGFPCRGCTGVPCGAEFFLLAELVWEDPPEHVVCVWKEEEDLKQLQQKKRDGADILVLQNGNAAYPMINDKTTLYICKDNTCSPPINL